jgi:agmatine deiminase
MYCFFYCFLLFRGKKIRRGAVVAKKEHAADRKPAQVLYTMPEEGMPHEGTWLQWPHQYQYGEAYRDRLDDTWIAMTDGLSEGEKDHIIVYDEEAKDRMGHAIGG